MYVTAAGMVCSVGLSAESACAAIRARIAGFEETNFLNTDQQFTVGARVASLTADLPYAERLGAMLSQSIRDCLQGQSMLATERIPLLVGAAEAGRPGGAVGSNAKLLADVSARLGINFHPTFSAVIPEGHTAGFSALRAARHLLTANQVAAALVCGVDSYLNRDSLAWLGDTSRLKTFKNSDGVIPGEAAAAVLVRREPSGAEPATAILGIGIAKEEASILNEDPLLGHGLSNAARAALAEAELGIEGMDFRMADVTGESYGFKEQALMVSRLLRSSKDKFPLWDFSASIGDVGAAVGITQLVVAHVAFKKGYAPGERALCCTSAVPGQRAVLVIQG
jgi:3-oxoacyl-[acyl-carrier-protein] synthase I